VRQVNCDPFLGANEGQQVGVYLFRVCGGHSVRQPGIGPKRSVLQEFDRSRAGGRKRANLVVLAMHYQDRNIDDRQIIVEFSLPSRQAD